MFDGLLKDAPFCLPLLFLASLLAFLFFVLLLLLFLSASSAWALFLASLQLQCLCDRYRVRGLACACCLMLCSLFCVCCAALVFSVELVARPSDPGNHPRHGAPAIFKRLSVLTGVPLSLLSHLCRTFYIIRCLLSTAFSMFAPSSQRHHI